MTRLELALLPKGELRSLSSPSETNNKNDVTKSLTNLYESYASLFPNPHLIQERQESHKLLQALSAASQAQLDPQKKPSSSGFFRRFLWGKSNLSATNTNNQDTTIVDTKLSYQIPENDDNDDSLLGTDSLDASCIPTEAHAAARLHLTSSRAHAPIVVRSAWEKPGVSILTIPQMGVLVEAKTKEDTAELQYTSDHEALLRRGGEHSPLSFVRAASVGPNLLAVSWGFTDGIVTIYRRLVAGHSGKHWQVVASVSPSPEVLDQLGEDEDYLNESSLLRVTDIIPLVVEQMDQIPAVTLAISRLSGFIELVPLPHAIWYGPELSVPPSRRNNKIPTLTQCTTVLSTGAYHVDIMALDVFRTSVEEDTVWDPERYPHSPPAEYVLAATGSSEENHHQIVTFWSISTVLGSPDASSTIGFSLVAQLAEAWDVGKAGPDVSIMATGEIMRNWRKSRKVELRDDLEPDERQNEVQVASLSLPAPIVSLRFLCETDCVRLALLDWNSGVTILDCDLLERNASQCLSIDEYNAIHVEADTPAPLVRSVSHRGSVLEFIPTDLPPTIVSVEWPSRALLSHSISRMECCIVALSSRPPALHIAPITSDPAVQYSSVELSSFAVSRLYRQQSNGSVSVISTRLNKSSNGIEKDVLFAKLEPMDPKEIVRALARESKMQDSIATYSSLSEEEQQSLEDTIEECRCQLWKSHQDLSCLEAIKDVEYVFQEAIHFGESQMDDDEASFEQYRRVHKIALAKLLETHLNSSTSEQMGIIRERLITVGTYELLCTYMGVPMSFRRFRQDVLNMTSLELAIGFAQMSDLAAVSVIYYRHRPACLKSFAVLDQIPLTVPVEDYQHLLPVTKEGGMLFLNDVDSFANIDQMPEYVKSRFGVNCTLGEEDATLVLEHAMADQKNKKDRNKDEEWYLGRTDNIGSFLSSVSDLASFTERSLIALGIDKEIDRTPSADRLIRLHQRYQIMSDMARDDVYNGYFVQRFNEFHASDDMELGGLLGFVLDGFEDPDQIFQRFQGYFLPLAEQCIAAGVDFAGEISKAVRVFCQKTTRESGSVAALRHAVSVCSTFVSFSRNCIHKETRIIREKQQVMDLVLAIADTVMDLGGSVITSEYDMRYIIHKLWIMYESLPARGLSVIEAGEEYIELCDSADYLFQDLVAIEICNKWLGPGALSLVSERRRNRQFPSVTDAKIVANICGAFCNQVSSLAHGANADFLSHLVADISTLSKTVFQGKVDLKECISDFLLSPLLQNGQIHLLAECILISDREWLDFERLKDSISMFVNAAVFSEGEDAAAGGVSTAISCQELLSQSLPGLDLIFKEIRQCLDAAHFINTVILPASAQMITPTEVRRLHGEDLVDLLLERDPFVTVLHAEKWKDSDWSETANCFIRASTSVGRFPQDDSVPTREEPVLPGQAILHLSTIVGVKSAELHTITIKMAHLCTQHGMYGAAAALCRSVLVDGAMLSRKHTSQILNVIEVLVSCEEYTDGETKRELCTLTLALKHCDLSIDSTAKFMRAVAASTQLEYGRLSSYQVRNPLPSLQRLCRDTSEEYAVDLVHLFSSLHSQSDSCNIDDELLNTIGRYAAFWCIAQCTRPKRGDPVPLDTTCITFNLLLSTFIFLHMHDSALRMNCFEEVKTIFADQRASAMNLCLPNLAVEWVKPAEAIVQRLTNRGYSQNGALRATLMTQNRGYNDALQWAVTHSLDNGFDDPILILRKRDQVYVLKGGLTIVDAGVSELLPSLTNENSRASLFKAIGVDADFFSKLDEPQYRTGTSTLSPRKPGARNNGQHLSMTTKPTDSARQVNFAEEEQPGKASVIENGGAAKNPLTLVDGMQTNASTEEEDLMNEQQSKVIVEENVAMVSEKPFAYIPPPPPPRPTLSSPPPPPPLPRGRSSPPVPPATSTKTASPTRAPPIPTAPPPKQVLSPPAAAPPPPRHPPHVTGSVSVPPSIRPPLPPPTFVHQTPIWQTPKRTEDPIVLTPKTRSVMLKRGEVLLHTSKAASPDLSSEDRQRLIAQGRRLLQQSRTKVTDTPSVTHHRYSLRSKGSPKDLFNSNNEDNAMQMTDGTAPPSSNDVGPEGKQVKSTTNTSPANNDDSFDWNSDADDTANDGTDAKNTSGWDFDEDDL